MPQPIPIAEIPPFLNDLRVIAALPLETASDIMIVLVDRGAREAPDQFVVAEWRRGNGASWSSGDYHEHRRDAFAALLERARTPLPKPHDENSAPPEGFERYRIELDAPIGFSQDAILMHAQQFAIDLIDNAEDDGMTAPSSDVIDAIENRISVCCLEG